MMKWLIGLDLRRSTLTLFLILCGTVVADISVIQPGRHNFPSDAVDVVHGNLLSHELQLIKPEGITQNLDSSYMFSSVGPLAINNDDIVSVTYSSKTPMSTDWIGAYSPGDVDITKTVPVKYGWCDDGIGGNYLNGENVTLHFNLTNLRASVKFYYFRSSDPSKGDSNALKAPVQVAVASQVVNFINPNEPLRPRVTPTGDPDTYNMLWSSQNSLTPRLQWGLNSFSKTGLPYPMSYNATTSTIPQSSMCGPPANTTGWRDLGQIHWAKFTGMKKYEAGTKVYYRFGDFASNLWSKEYIFFVPPLAGQVPKTRPTRVVLYDDLGRGSTDGTFTWNEYGRPSMYTIMAVGAEVAAGNIDAVYHGGDISYATGYAAVWDFFLDMLSPVSSSVLYMTTVGNHESGWYNGAHGSYYSVSDSGGECGVMTTSLIPQPSPATVDRPWWSYDVGLIHFIGISTEHNCTIGSPQYKWLENDLKHVDRTKTPWIIFGGHRAMYINSDYGGPVTSDINVMDYLISNMEPLLYKYRVNLGFYGHNHAVQRQAAVLNKKVVQYSTMRLDDKGNEVYWHRNPQSTVHMLVGTGGAAFTKNAETPGPDFSERVFYQWGYARVTAVNSSFLHWEWINSTNNLVVDQMIITQDGQPWKPVESNSQSNSPSRLGPTAVIGIIIGTLFGTGLLAAMGLHIYHRYSVKTATALSLQEESAHSYNDMSSHNLRVKERLSVERKLGNNINNNQV